MDIPTLPARVLPEIETELVVRGGSDGAWALFEMELREGLSAIYEARIVAATDERYPDVTRLLGERVTVRIRRGDVTRQLHGVIARVEEGELHADGRALLDLLVVPELWFLSKRVDSRIFAHEPTPRIVRQVLDAAGLYAGDALALHLASDEPHTHAPREYCVQYQESDLAFFQRLLEEEGSTFYFLHDRDDRERLVIVDGTLAAQSATYEALDNGDGHTTVRVVPGDRLELEATQTVHRFFVRAEVQSNAVTLRDHDFTSYGQRDLWTASRTDRAPRPLEVYEHPGRLLFKGDASDVGGSGPTIVDSIVGTLRGASGGRLVAAESDTLGETVRAAIPTAPYPPLPRHSGHTGNALAAARLEAHRQRVETFEGRGIVIGFAPGIWFDLTEHTRDALDRQYVITSVVHEVHAAEWSRDERARYTNKFRCIPRTVPHRPERSTARPRIQGTQTATVVGGPGDEMHVDPYGRVRVQFHWDRQHRLDEQAPAQPPITTPMGTPSLGVVGVALAAASPAGDPRTVCWVRCAQAWAGPHWGSVFIPRVGMEVVVTFLDGDPDRPLVVGCVYNSANPPPYPLPAQYHRSTIMSRSIPSSGLPGGSVGFNELRFDDLAGREQIYVHAQKDLTEVVHEHHETWVGGSHDLEVMRHETIHVGGDQEEVVGQNQSIGVGRNQSSGIGGNRELRVRGVDFRWSQGGRLAQTNNVDGLIVNGTHLHYVMPPTVPSIESRPEIAAMLGSVRRAAAEAGGPPAPEPSETPGPSEPSGVPVDVDPAAMDWSGDGEDGGGDDAGGEGGDAGGEGGDAGGSGGGGGASFAAIETWIVEGDREVRITGEERARYGSRHTTVSGDDRSTADGRVLVTGEMVGIAATGGTTKGLAFLGEDGDRLRIFRGGDQELRMESAGVGMRNTNAQYLSMMGEDPVGTVLHDDNGPVKIEQGVEDDTAGMRIEEGTVRVYAKGEETYVDVLEEDATVRASGEITLSRPRASIKLKSDGSIEIRAEGGVDLYGPLRQH